MTISLSDLKAKRAAMTPGEWFARGQHLSRVPDNSGMGGTLHTNHIGNVADREDATGIVATHNAANVLIEIAEAALRWRHAQCDAPNECGDGYTYHSHDCPTNEAQRALVDAIAKITT